MELAASTTGAAFREPTPILPALPLHLGGAIGWGLLMAACAYISLVMQGRAETFHLQTILSIYATGGFAAWLIALPMARLLTRRRSVETRFAAHFALLGLGLYFPFAAIPLALAGAILCRRAHRAPRVRSDVQRTL